MPNSPPALLLRVIEPRLQLLRPGRPVLALEPSLPPTCKKSHCQELYNAIQTPASKGCNFCFHLNRIMQFLLHACKRCAAGMPMGPACRFPNARGELPPHRSDTSCHRSKGVPQWRRCVPIFKLAGQLCSGENRNDASYRMLLIDSIGLVRYCGWRCLRNRSGNPRTRPTRRDRS